ncbi:MAG TPA: FtsQ-type POTRA domain-containing protein [Actinobacteria bacterium]|nr:FtsQ-type POTRA domain-containing protein [Actinomycetota bacterium]
MTIDPRMAARRQDVAESRARIDLRRFLWLAVVLVVIAVIVWILTSPLMSVRTITILGASNADPSQILTEQNVVDGRPLIAIRPGRVAEALETDPWIKAASVELVFPDTVDVNVAERVAVAWVSLGDKWGLVAEDGVVLQYGERPQIDPLVELIGNDPGLGESVVEVSIVGAIEFISALPVELAAATSVIERDGELWASVGVRQVRLGRAIDMTAKAAAVSALVDSELEGVIDVIAPARPAIWALEPPDDSNDESDLADGDGEPSADSG